MMIIIIALVCAGTFAAIAALLIDYYGFSKRMKNFDKHYINNDEFDFGHNVKHNEE